MTKTIDDRSIRPDGYWPTNNSHKYLAVMPSTNKKIETDEVNNEDNLLLFDPHTELIYVSLAASIALSPHFLIGYHFV